MRKPLAPINKDLVPETITFEQAAEMAEICNNCLMDAAVKGMIELKKIENGSFVINTISLLDYINEIDRITMMERRKERLNYLIELKRKK